MNLVLHQSDIILHEMENDPYNAYSFNCYATVFIRARMYTLFPFADQSDVTISPHTLPPASANFGYPITHDQPFNLRVIADESSSIGTLYDAPIHNIMDESSNISMATSSYTEQEISSESSVGQQEKPKAKRKKRKRCKNCVNCLIPDCNNCKYCR